VFCFKQCVLFFWCFFLGGEGVALCQLLRREFCTWEPNVAQVPNDTAFFLYSFAWGKVS